MKSFINEQDPTYQKMRAIVNKHDVIGVLDPETIEDGEYDVEIVDLLNRTLHFEDEGSIREVTYEIFDFWLGRAYQKDRVEALIQDLVPFIRRYREERRKIWAKRNQED